MSVNVDPEALTDAQNRIRDAFDPQMVRACGTQMMERLADHFTAVQSRRDSVLNWHAPRENADFAKSFLKGFEDRAGSDPAANVRRFGELIETMLARGHNLHDPRYVGHQVPASLPLAGLFDALGSITNQVTAIYEMSPWASACEAAVIEALGEQFGLRRGTFSGTITHGGSLANTTALLTARNVVFRDSWEQGTGSLSKAPVIVSHAEAHYCIARTAGILGLGTNHIVKAELDEKRRIDPQKLDAQLSQLRRANQPVMAVVACACATPIGAFDPLNDIADVCRKHDVWLHVDAAHGGAACFSDRYGFLIAGLERADSFICDAHKMLFVPALCAFVFYRDKRHRFETFRQDAPYLFDPSAPGLADFDGGLKTVECTRRATAYGLWGVWSLFGPQLFADMVDVTFDMGRRFYELLDDAADFVPLHEPQCNIVAFRYIPEALHDAPPERIGRFQLDLRREVIESGEFYLVPTSRDGIAALRMTIINPLTTLDHLQALLQTLRERGRRILQRT